MTTTLDAPAGVPVADEKRYAIIDTDVHPDMTLAKRSVVARLPQRWQEYVAEYGIIRPGNPGGDRPRHREFASRWDTEPPEGGAPMSNPDFAREQLLDRYDHTAAILNDIAPVNAINGGRNTPRQLAAAMCTAVNEDRVENWFAHDPRWYGSINTPYEIPELAVKEIQRCKEDPQYGDRWRQVMFAPDNMNPPGHEKYYPIYEICEEYDLPIGMHVLASHRITASGSPNFYFEEHCDWAAYNFPVVSSLVFEGVFERFPRLKIALIELAWSWAAPLAWRMDKAYQLMRSEVPHLDRLPSEYMRDHIWYSTQPMEEPEKPEYFEEVYAAFEASGMGDQLMYSSDYPHWDFDEPAALPASLTDEQRRKILGGNASALYGIPLKPNSGVVLP
jgi:uncharacterized protein